jgi:hypothetical protein
MPGLAFRVWVCRAAFETQGSLRFPALAGNAFRGALGFRLPAEVFAPRHADGPSGLRDRPRPFVLRAAHLDSAVLPAGACFELGLNVFLPAAADALREALGGLRIQGSTLILQDFSVRVASVDLAARAAAPPAARVRLVTPLAMKGWKGEGLPPFAVLAARLRDRVSALASFYGQGPLELDFAGLALRAALVEARGGELVEREWHRRSSRTGRTNPMGGAVGWVEYAGPLAEFLGLLEAGYWAGVGRHTVWGQGWIELCEPAAG